MNFSSHLPGLLDFLGKGLLVSAAALSAAWTLRRASAAQRHLVWLCAAGVLLALPGVSGSRGAAASPAAASVEGAGPVVIVRIPAAPVVEPSPGAAAPIVAESFGGQARRWVVGQGWRGALTGLWAAGVLAGLAGQCLAMARLRGLRRRSQAPADRSLLAATEGLAREAGLRRRVEWRVSEDAPVAMTWGWWRPVVLLPRAALAWPRERLELVLRHELAHVARGDSFTRGLAGLACVLHWPNPLVWLLARRLRLAQEQACDDAVLAAGASAEAYAEELLAAARAWGNRDSRGVAVAMAEPSTLERRILGVLGVVRRDKARRSAVLVAWVAAGCVLAGCATVRVGERPAVPAVEGSEVRTSPADRRQVEVEVRFVELKGEAAYPFDAKAFFGAALTPGATTSAAVLGHLTSDEASRRLRELSTRYKFDTLSAPKVTVLNGNRATITVAQEMRYPGAFDAPPNEETAYETRNVGVEASVLPKILSDGSVALDVQTMIREFEGFLGGPPNAGVTSGEKAPEGAEILVPIFVERADSAAVVLRPGQVAVLRASGKKKVMPEKAPEWAWKSMATAAPEDQEQARPVLIFVGAKVITPTGGLSASPPPAR